MFLARSLTTEAGPRLAATAGAAHSVALAVTALGGSVATPAEGIVAEGGFGRLPVASKPSP